MLKLKSLSNINNQTKSDDAPKKINQIKIDLLIYYLFSFFFNIAHKKPNK